MNIKILLGKKGRPRKIELSKQIEEISLQLEID
jgi:hypothetical protein